MNDTLHDIELYRRSKLKELYHRCTKEQQDFFCRLHGSVIEISEDKINHAIRQCERTIEMNKENEV